MPDPRRERNKKLLVYDPAMHDYSTEAPQWRELRPRHWFFAAAAEARSGCRRLSCFGSRFNHFTQFHQMNR